VIRDPRTAPARPDLSYLRHRSRPHPSIVYVHPAATPLPSRPVAPPISVPTVPEPDSAGAPARELNELDLSGPAPRPPAVSSPVATSPPANTAAHRRTRRGSPSILTPKAPALTLTRIQSGVGALTIEAACSPAVGDLRLGCAYQLASGLSSVVQLVDGVGTAPAGSSRPVIIASHGHYDRLTIDLVQSRDIERLVVYAFSASSGILNWGGTLVVTTFGQDRVELPLDRPPSAKLGVLLSLYNVRGEFVLRAEMEEVAGSVRDAVNAYGFDSITWLDQRTPLV
jgi:uncharacterized protein involved in tellurium resistance